MLCSKDVDVHRYHDGELSPSEAASMAEHLRTCTACRLALADLQGLSTLIASSAMAELPANTLRRLRENAHRRFDTGITRLAGWLTGVAAAILIGALLTWPAPPTEGPSRPAVWETLAVLPPEQVQDDVSSDLIVMAEWMADELSSGERR